MNPGDPSCAVQQTRAPSPYLGEKEPRKGMAKFPQNIVTTSSCPAAGGGHWALFYKGSSAHPPSRAMLALSPPRGREQGTSGRCRPPRRCSQCPGCSPPRRWPSPSTPLPGPAASARLLSAPAAPALPPAPPCTAGSRGCSLSSGTGSRLRDRRQVTLTQSVLSGDRIPRKGWGHGEALRACQESVGRGRTGQRAGVGRTAGRDGQHRGLAGHGRDVPPEHRLSHTSTLTATSCLVPLPRPGSGQGQGPRESPSLAAGTRPCSSCATGPAFSGGPTSTGARCPIPARRESRRGGETAPPYPAW